jgi:hypothetical protein
MKITLYCSIIALLMAMGGCFAPDKPGSGLYFYHPVADGKAESDTLLTPISFLELRSDGSYTQDFGHFDYGAWMLKDRRLYLTNQRHRTYIYQAMFPVKGEMDLTLDGDRNGHFLVHAMPSAKPEKDPFSKYNNQWRIPATHKESDAEIRKRLYNHCEFWEAYFSWAQDKQGGSIEVQAIPTPLKIYGNGFGLKHYDNLPAAWKKYFYDEEDCHKADTLIKHTFRRHDFVWPNTDDDLKKLISGTHQLQQWLK